MKSAQKRGERPVVLDKRGEEILRAVHFYRYMTALDVANLLYSPASLTHVRGLLALLCGGGDYVGNQYLCRFGLPSIAGGNPERIYILGSRGREHLEREGLAVKWYFRADTVKRLSYYLPPAGSNKGMGAFSQWCILPDHNHNDVRRRFKARRRSSTTSPALFSASLNPSPAHQ